MRKIYFLILFGLIFISKMEAKKIEGEILFDNDTIQVTLKIPINFFLQEVNCIKLQNKLKYYNSQGIKKVLRPSDAKEIRFSFYSEDIRMVSVPNTLELGSLFSMDTNIFLKLEIDGKLKLFSYYYKQQSPGAYNATTGMSTGGYAYTEDRCILQKGNEVLKRPRWLFFKKDMIEYFRDCPELSKKIENKDFKKHDMESIVRYYNSHCK